MRRNLRRVLVLALVVMLAIPALSIASFASEGEKVKLTFWSWESEESYQLYFRDLVFKDLLDEIDIEMVSIPGGEYENKLRIAINAQNAPDIFYVDGVFTANFAHMGALLPLDEYWPREDFEDYIQSSQDKCMYDGKIYAASQNETSCVLFYNKDHFEAAGITDVPTTLEDRWTYDQLLDAARKLTIRDDSGAIVQYGFQPTMAAPDTTNEGMTYTQLLWLWNHGGEAFAPDMSTASGYFDSDASREAVRAFAALYTPGDEVAPLESIQQGFETGKISMHIHSVGLSSGYINSFPDLNFGIMPVPKGVKEYTTSGGWNVGVYSLTKHPDEAWKVIDAFTGKEGHKLWCEARNLMPSRSSTFPLIEKFSQFPYDMAVAELQGNPRARPITPVYATVSPILAEAFNAAAYGDDVDSIIGDATSRMDQVLAEFEATK